MEILSLTLRKLLCKIKKPLAQSQRSNINLFDQKLPVSQFNINSKQLKFLLSQARWNAVLLSSIKGTTLWEIRQAFWTILGSEDFISGKSHVHFKNLRLYTAFTLPLTSLTLTTVWGSSHIIFGIIYSCPLNMGPLYIGFFFNWPVQESSLWLGSLCVESWL